MGEEEKALMERLEQARKAQQMEAQKKALMLKLLEANAYERMMNVKIANPALYDEVITAVIYLYRSRQVKGKISEEQLVSLLKKLTAKKEGSIQFKRK